MLGTLICVTQAVLPLHSLAHSTESASTSARDDCPGCYRDHLPYTGWEKWTPESTSQDNDPFLAGKFPNDFLFGAATAAFQIEGAWKEEGRGASIWDSFCHNSSRNPDSHRYKCGHDIQQSGDVADDSYHRYEEDSDLLKDMGVPTYRLSLSWSRIVPTGHKKDGVNQAGIDHYRKVLEALRSRGIRPMITLYHWDLPQQLENEGGWPNRSVANDFADFATIAIENYGQLCDLWLTFNEAWTFIAQGYASGEWAKAPGITRNPYEAAHTVLVAHARAYRVFERLKAQGKVGANAKMSITNNQDWVEPYPGKSSAELEENILASYRSLMWQLGWFAEPVFGSGDYPVVMRTYVERIYRNTTKYTLPRFSAEDSPKGTFDFMGLNHYSTAYCTSRAKSGMPQVSSGASPDYWADQDASGFKNCAEPGFPPGQNQLPADNPSCWPYADSAWLTINSWGIRRILRFVKEEYPEANKKGIYITENGVDMPGENKLRGQAALVDTTRVNYYTSYINQVLKAVSVDGVNVKAYTAWSLLDNFEWDDGYNYRFGLIRVNYETQERTPKQSACVISQVSAANGFPDGWDKIDTPICRRWREAMQKALPHLED